MKNNNNSNTKLSDIVSALNKLNELNDMTVDLTKTKAPHYLDHRWLEAIYQKVDDGLDPKKLNSIEGSLYSLYKRP